MEPVEPPEELYDFIYKDEARLASYYAQSWGGRLISRETTHQTKTGTDRSGGLNLGAAKGDAKSIRESQASAKETIDPHDAATSDILSLLVQQRASTDWAQAKDRDLIVVKGDLFLTDALVVEMMGDIVANAMSGLVDAATMLQLGGLGDLSMMRTIVSKMPKQSTFTLELEDGSTLGGLIKDQYLDAPISGFYFLHGDEGLADVYVLGIKEGRTKARSQSIVQKSYAQRKKGATLQEATRQMAQALKRSMFPELSAAITPIAIFRAIGRGNDEEGLD